MSARTVARKPQDALTITTALLALLTALEGAPQGSPGAAAYIAALRRRGEELAAVGGPEALHEARTTATTAAPDRAQARIALIDAAWSTIPGWNS